MPPSRAHLGPTLARATCVVALAAPVSCRKASSGTPTQEAATARYVLYLHGKVVEDQGRHARHPVYGPYDYDDIVDAFRSRGFAVLSEVRPSGTDVDAYARKVVDQVRALTASGTPPENITVVGASKGALIAMRTSTLLAEGRVNFVVLDMCNDDTAPGLDLHGNVLSIYEESDDVGRSCQAVFAASKGIGAHDEVVTHTGLGHGVLYKPLPDWVEPAVAWASRAATPGSLAPSR
jgi:hypothetical protein